MYLSSGMDARYLSRFFYVKKLNLGTRMSIYLMLSEVDKLETFYFRVVLDGKPSSNQTYFAPGRASSSRGL